MNKNSNVYDMDSVEIIITTLREEIELAFRWNRPSIIFAIYNNVTSRKTAQTQIVAELLKSEIDQIIYQVEYDINNEFTALIERISGTKTILSIDPLNSGTSDSQVEKLIAVLDSHKNRIIDNRIKMIVWLTADESILFAHMAPDLWSSRHRVIELGSPSETKQSVAIFADNVVDEEIEVIYNFNDPLSSIDPEIENHLAMAVGAWRMKDLTKAESFINNAMSIARSNKSKTSLLVCLMAKHFIATEKGAKSEAADLLKEIRDLESSSKNLFVKTITSTLMSESLVQKFPVDAQSVIISTARELRSQNKDFEAIGALVDFANGNGSANLVWLELGDIYAELNIFDKAVVSYEKITEGTIDQNMVTKKMADCLCKIGEFERAIELYKKLIRSSTDENEVQEAWNNIGDIYRKTSGFDNAIAAYSMADQAKTSINKYESELNNCQSIDSSKLTPEMWNEIGNIFVRTNDLVEAESAYSKAIELCPDNAVAVGNLGILYSTLGKRDQAMNYLLKGIELFERPTEKSSLWNLVGDQYRLIGKYTEAITAYTTADELVKNSPDGNLSVNFNQLFSSISQSVR